MVLRAHEHAPWLLRAAPDTEIPPASGQAPSGWRPEWPAPSGDALADEMFAAMQETEPVPRYTRPERPKGERVANPTWSEITDTYTHVRLDTLYFGVDALANWRIRQPE